MPETSDKEKRISTWATILNAVDSPVTRFALAVLVSDAVFASIGAFQHSEKLMIFSMHMFLAILAAFVLVSIWKPMVLYHPRYWHISKELHNSDKIGSWVITVVLALSMLVYMSYRYFMDSRHIEAITTYIAGPEVPVASDGVELKTESCKKSVETVLCTIIIEAPSNMTALRLIVLPAAERSIYATELKLKDKKIVVEDRPVSLRMELEKGKPNELTLLLFLSEVRTFIQSAIDVPIGIDFGKGEIYVEFRDIPLTETK